MNSAQEFYKNGCLSDALKKTPVYDRTMSILFDLVSGKVKSDFEFTTKKKYENGLDLRPHPDRYDPCFLDLLFDQNIPTKLKEVTGLDLFLALIKIRINLPGEPYTGWHRDTSFYDNVIKGNVPPVVNVHVYPSFNQISEPALRVWEGTHLNMSKSFLIDKFTVISKKSSEIITSDEEYALFDTSLIHSVSKTKYKNGAIRLMYSFCRDFQLKEYGDEHQYVQEAYKSRL